MYRLLRYRRHSSMSDGEAAMHPLTCPRCGQIDQVRSVATVYTAGSGIGAGTAPMGYHYGPISAVSSQLAMLVAPHTPPYRPQRAPSGWEFALFLCVGVPGTLIAGYAVSARDAPSLGARFGGLFIGLTMLAIPVIGWSFAQPGRRRRWAAYEAYQRIWPEVARAWWEAFLCLRCHIAFYAAGALQGVDAARRMIPLPEFRVAVLAVASQATSLAELAARGPAAGTAVTAEPPASAGIPGFGEPVTPTDAPADPEYPPIPPDL
jgi:hypothetical protein